MHGTEPNSHPDSGLAFTLWVITVTALVAAAPLAALATASSRQAPVENPHGKFREDCSLCHGANAWKPARIRREFDHAKYGFALEGAHAAAACVSCHTTLDFTREKAVCASCHEDVHRGEFGTACDRCHTTRSFIDPAGMARMHQATRFPLVGAHAILECERCHEGAAAGRLAFVGVTAECQGCHLNDYRATTNPAHQAGGFPLECSSCHTTATWRTTRFDHAGTGFPLTGAHRSVTCQQCHGDGVYAGKPTACVACHLADYNGTTNPGHGSSGFSTDCTACHGTGSWSGAAFDHSATAFALTGAHRNVACLSCHGDGVYAGKPTACVACHLADYNGTTNPGHGASGFSTDCTSCHGTASWSGAAFDHSATAFPLTGAHRTVACLSCHGDGVYAGKPTACVSCHLTDYSGTTSPNHSVLAFSTDCASCHTTSGWAGATFDHDTSFFPIYSGRHAGIWANCTTCHTVSTTYAAFTCFSCHPHDDRAGTDSHHTSVRNYVYDSQACYSCHPRGRAG